jgi:hypothetical protein
VSLQVAAAGTQHWFAPARAMGWHSSAPQQPIDDVHERSPSASHAPSYAHTCATHDMPVQQSEASSHAAPRGRHMHARVVVPSQSIRPQQSAVVVHIVPARRQHARLDPSHAGVAAHVPSMQASPGSHAPFAQHA